MRDSLAASRLDFSAELHERSVEFGKTLFYVRRPRHLFQDVVLVVRFIFDPLPGGSVSLHI